MNSPINKEIFRETGCMSAETLLQYRDGKLSSVQRHQIEHHLTDCPLCSDALEGLASVSSMNAVNEINRELQRQATGTNAPSYTRYIAIAASVTAIALLSWFGWNQFHEINEERMALNETTEETIETVQPSEQSAPLTVPFDGPRIESKPLPDPNGNRTKATTVTPEPIQDASADLAEVVTESEVQSDNLVTETAPAPMVMEEKSAVSGATAPASTFLYNNSNVTYIDNLKIVNYAGNDATGMKDAVNKKHTPSAYQNREQQIQAAKAEEEAEVVKRKVDYETMVTNPLLLYNQKKYDAAIDGFNRLLQINPKDENARFYKAMSFHHLGKYEKAIELLEPLAADSASPFMEESMFYLANSYANIGQKVPASNLYNNIIKNNGFYNQRAKEEIKNLK